MTLHCRSFSDGCIDLSCLFIWMCSYCLSGCVHTVYPPEDSQRADPRHGCAWVGAHVRACVRVRLCTREQATQPFSNRCVRACLRSTPARTRGRRRRARHGRIPELIELLSLISGIQSKHRKLWRRNVWTKSKPST